MDARARLQYKHAVHKVQKSLVAASELTIAAHGFKINPCAEPPLQKGWTALH